MSCTVTDIESCSHHENIVRGINSNKDSSDVSNIIHEHIMELVIERINIDTMLPQNIQHKLKSSNNRNDSYQVPHLICDTIEHTIAQLLLATTYCGFAYPMHVSVIDAIEAHQFHCQLRADQDKWTQLFETSCPESIAHAVAHTMCIGIYEGMEWAPVTKTESILWNRVKKSLSIQYSVVAKMFSDVDATFCSVYSEHLEI